MTPSSGPSLQAGPSRKCPDDQASHCPKLRPIVPVSCARSNHYGAHHHLGPCRQHLTDPDARTKLVIAALTIAAFAIGLDTFVIIGTLDVISRDLAISTGAAGSIISIYALCYAVFAPLNAWMFKAVSGHNVQILSVSLFIIGNLICAIAPNFHTLAAGRVIAAYGAATFTPTATALAARISQCGFVYT
ncbi:hypothetical protein XI03_20685 [Bradyrhizobium sp. CCBAU 65884]|uniref:MFS transporter n=1 Tax=Bradyrhizobium sp. CCBAU 65884 TaxID=722477 RepID=UPI002305A89D|nr:MFS transporter [Bradyrhizobium sp. CCBAU 65884]MDA9476863.1 hypothetical protein [Bradyrhizobium sp. CCBAU 65884]